MQMHPRKPLMYDGKLWSNKTSAQGLAIYIRKWQANAQSMYIGRVRYSPMDAEYIHRHVSTVHISIEHAIIQYNLDLHQIDYLLSKDELTEKRSKVHIIKKRWK